MLPSKIKITGSDEIRNGDFLHMVRHVPCLLLLQTG